MSTCKQCGYPIMGHERDGTYLCWCTIETQRSYKRLIFNLSFLVLILLVALLVNR